MFEKVESRSGPEATAAFIRGEHQMLKFWRDHQTFQKLKDRNAGKKPWSFLDGPITANNPMGVHHAWGRTYKDAFQRYHAMTGHELRYQNGFDCQGLWVEVEVERELDLGTKTAIAEFGIDRFVNECKKRVLRFAARQTEQSMRLGYWMEWDDPDQLRNLAEHLGTDEEVTLTTPRGEEVSGPAHQLVSRLGNPEWGGSYFTFSTENNETIWQFLKKCFEREKVYRGYDVMPWGGRAGTAYSQMEVADGRKLTTHRSLFVRFPLKGRKDEYLLVWTTTPWTLTSNVAAAVNPDLDYVKIQTKRDGAVYYFAKENLEYQRLGKEFKDGFGRPEWKWPKGVPKLKTLAQIFKEQGGFEELEVLKGKDMIGWAYEGPFDDLPAQSQPGGYPVDEQVKDTTGVECHRVIDGGRDNKGNPNVVAGEGTGIVHIAPGCGDIDYKIGQELGLVRIAPLEEDGTFGEDFGDFTGKKAVAPETVDLVLEKLEGKHLLVSVEQYPHVYPHCWRTGEELVFRLVDEWFINMDWRKEIMDVTREVQWLPDSIQGEEREIEWLTNMRDWMISKKRFWGLALPIWYDEETGDFEIIGSLAELKERAVEGWEQLEGNTPHRPWIDAVKIENPKNGNLMRRIEDVGNPWLDAGIVAFSTMGWNTNRDEWERWYPADFVTECFPGQFRNWFYAMLSMSTMMANRQPFKTLLGHRLVMNEDGKPMHKSDGTAIWFEEAAEQLGVDTIRWMYLQQNPAQDLRFGKRHPENHVTLETVDGPTDHTKEGLPTCAVTSSPADEVRRQVLMPLWNSYQFFVNYARLDEMDPRAEPIPVQDRPEIDRWLLSNVQALVKTANEAFESYDTPELCRAAARFIDDLSNWYIRRNRRRFWRSKDAGDTDKLAAYQTLHETLVTLTKVLAPAMPFITEEMYRNLVTSWNEDAPASVHLCEYPQPDEALLDESLNHRMALIQQVVSMGLKARTDAGIRVRQPLSELVLATDRAEDAKAIESLAELATEELNVKNVKAVESLSDLISYSFKPNFKTLGPKYKDIMGPLRKTLSGLDEATLAPLAGGQSVDIDVDGTKVTLETEDVLISTESAEGWAGVSDRGVQVALNLELTDELVREGIARDFVRNVQQLRKDHDLEIEDRIRIFYVADGPVAKAIEEHSGYIEDETLADSLESASAPDDVKPQKVGDDKIPIWIEKV